MPHSLNAPQVLDREFLAVRCKLIELAATLDRLDRAEGSLAADPRLEKIRRSCGILAGNEANKAEQLQMLFSLPYQKDWRAQYGL